jgi:hypothetical protein
MLTALTKRLKSSKLEKLYFTQTQSFGSGSGSAWIRINLSFWIRIRIQFADPDLDPGGQK